MKLIKKLLKWLVIGIVAIIVLAVVFGGSGDKDTETANPTAQPTKVAAARSTDKPKATNTTGPTSTPAPTNTPASTSTPVPPPEPVILSGSGQQATEEFYLPSTIAVANFTHNGSSNFVVMAYVDDGEELLVNEIGSYRGSRPLVSSGPVMLDIDADGAWTVKIVPLGVAASASFNGKGDAVSGIFDPPSRGAWEISHDGQSNFVVLCHCVGGSDLVQNEIGAVSGSSVITFDKGPCFWEVEADGNWSLKPR